MSRYLLDTNVVSDLVRHPRGAVAERVRAVGEDAVCTSIIVAAELRFGAAKKASPKLTQQLEDVLDVLEVIPFESPAEIRYGSIRAELVRTGNLVGGNDILIAAHALALGYTLVTDNEREFSRVANLPIENWVRDR